MADGDIRPPEVRFYTRPGCPFSMLLERRLRSHDIAYRRIDIWDDPDAAAAVRAAANGNETVPTVGIGDVMLVNPGLREIDAVLAEARSNG